jgi:hypothetical protein
LENKFERERKPENFLRKRSDSMFASIQNFIKKNEDNMRVLLPLEKDLGMDVPIAEVLFEMQLEYMDKFQK